MTPCAFAIPGDIDTLTGGFIYERQLLEALRAQGRTVRHVVLPAGFPDPSPADVSVTAETLRGLAADRPVLLDGFISGALPTEGIAQLRAPFVPVAHHPLALEEGLAPERAEWLYRNERANLALAAHVIVPSLHTRSILVHRYALSPDRITVARPGVARPEGTPCPADPPLILSVGILHPRKGHDVLIAALGRIRDLDWQAVVVGADRDPSHAAALAAQVDAEGLGNRLRFTGSVDTAELHRLYRAARLFALATRYEGYGLVFDEALAAGLPIVSCATGAVPDTVPADAGFLVPPADAAAFADAIRILLTDSDAYATRRNASERHGAVLSDWCRTAEIAGAVLDRVSLPRD